MLAELYNDMIAEDPNSIEIIFVSSDHDEASFNQYYSEQPWTAIPFNQTMLKSVSDSCKYCIYYYYFIIIICIINIFCCINLIIFILLCVCLLVVVYGTSSARYSFICCIRRQHRCS